VGALADDTLRQSLRDQAAQHATQLQVVSGAVGALDALSAARAGGLRSVLYRGIKPPVGWLGSPAEERLDLANLKTASTHFRGTARDAALAYPKNANVAAAIALAGAGFDETQVELIADPRAHLNRHEINVSGEFGRFSFVIDGQALPDNPKSSALTAMSVVSALGRLNAAIVV
ncbi:MAG: aspartate dehydrogenase, partial [Pseudomonadota bacterium]